MNGRYEVFINDVDSTCLYRGDDYKTILAAFVYTVMNMSVDDDYDTVYMWDWRYNRCVARYDIEDN